MATIPLICTLLGGMTVLGGIYLIIITAPVTSPYVVTGGPPIKPATHTPKPSPASVLSKPGSAA